VYLSVGFIAYEFPAPVPASLPGLSKYSILRTSLRPLPDTTAQSGAA